jgi:tetratricopeptide (TPR) repeat protein
MKANLLRTLLLFLILSAAFQLPAQQSEADRKLLADIRAKVEKGDAKSQFELGNTFYHGNLGLEKNYAEAVKWFRKAAEQKSASSQYYLGLCYYNGEGVAKDYVQAVKWCRKAAEQNIALAQVSLGACYANDQGVARDYVEAYKWFLLASAQGCEDARERLTTLETRMSREQIANAYRLARPFYRETISFINTSGEVITNAEVVRVEENACIIWRRGASAGRVKLADLPEDLSARFSYPQHRRGCEGIQAVPAGAGQGGERAKEQ